jgi:DDE superfamily endonuclease
MATGQVIGSIHCRHRAREFKKFLERLDEEVSAELDVHLILDNYGTHKTPNIPSLAAAPSAHPPSLHPDVSSCLNMIEQ